MSSENHQELFRRGTDAPASRMLIVGVVLAVAGLTLFVLQVTGEDPARGWRIFLVNFLFFTGIAVGANIFAAIQKVVKSRWSGAIIRFAEATVFFLPISLVCFLVLFLGRNELFPWIEHPTPARGQWLTVPWVFTRDLVSLLALFGLTIAFVYHDLKPDVAELAQHVSGWRRRLYERIAGGYTGTPEQTAKNDARIGWLAPLLIVAYAYLFSILAFDLIMSLAPYWISNLFGAFFFMGAFLTGLTMLGLMTVYWRRKLGLHAIIHRHQFHDLGKLVFGFSVFWAYLMYSQLLVIWYGNLREETAWVFWRLSGDWRPLAIAVGLLVFLIPFWGLIWVKSKTTVLTFTTFLSISIVGFWLERYLLVQPSLIDSPQFGLPEIGVSLGFLGLFLAAYALFAQSLPMVSPRLTNRAEAMEFHH
jgi:Ni/Fe-hydrogenase subunit HybB-like protein